DIITLENMMSQATNYENLELPMLLSGIRINTSPTDYFPIEQMQLMRFDGKRWVRFGEVMGNGVRPANHLVMLRMPPLLSRGGVAPTATGWCGLLCAAFIH